MIVQRESAHEVIRRSKALGKRIVVGGPYWAKDTANHDEVDHVIVGEAEHLLPEFIRDFENGCAKRVYSSASMPDLKDTPSPDLDLIRLKNYSSMLLQFSRGCPFNCEFCDIIEIYGRKARCKSNGQFVSELDLLYAKGWRGAVFIVDDNFIGNKTVIRNLLPHLIDWQKKHGYPFNFFTEASVNLAREDDMIKNMVEAGFRKVFLGIETPVQESLKLTQKMQNTTMDLLESGRVDYWKFLVRAYRRNAAAFSEAVTLAIMGYHFQKVTKLQLNYR